jgi:3-dehydroquinate synthase
MNRQNVRTKLSETYPIITGFGIEADVKSVFSGIYVKKAFFIVDGNVIQKQSSFVNALMQHFGDVSTFVVKPGEASKNTALFLDIIDFCLNQGVSRATPLIAIGGGVVGDLAGFAASAILRGLPLYHFPTTLLAMVDSAIGGKTGVNHSTGKNLIGSFYQPQAVLSEMNTLETLPHEEFICGFGEVLKYGAIADTAILDILKTKSLSELKENKTQLESILQRCIKIKSDIVSRDTKESGDRAYLNYGHTFAHALEKIMGYGTISHGQAVYTGMIAAGFLSEFMQGNLDHKLLGVHAKEMNIPIHSFKFTAQELVDAMQSDKKIKDSTLRFVLLNRYGRPYVTESKNIQMVFDSWQKAMDYIADQSR